MLGKITHDIRIHGILWNNLSNGKKYRFFVGVKFSVSNQRIEGD